MEDNNAAPGWDAINAATARIYGKQEPRHWGTLLKFSLGGPDPLDGVSCFDAGDHWHWVGFGLSELYENTDPGGSNLKSESGWGIELTFRLNKGPGETRPPMWPVGVLQNLARHVFRSENVLRTSHHMDLQSPLGPDEVSLMRGAIFVADPELGAIETPHGAVRFVQLVGVTLDELEAVKDWQVDGFAGVMRERNPRLVTDLARPSLREDEAVERTIQMGIDRDGSSYGAAFADVVRWQQDDQGAVVITIGAVALPDMARMLRGRIPFSRAFHLFGPDASIVFWPEGVDRREDEEGVDALYVDLSAELSAIMRETLADPAATNDPARRRSGTYTWKELPGMTLVVEPTEILDGEGNLVRVVD